MTKTWGGQIHGLTVSRHRVLRAIVDYWDAHSFSPSIRDLADAVGVEKRAAGRTVGALTREKFVTKHATIHRSIVVTDAGRRALRKYETGREANKGE